MSAIQPRTHRYTYEHVHVDETDKLTRSTSNPTTYVRYFRRRSLTTLANSSTGLGSSGSAKSITK